MVAAVMHGEEAEAEYLGLWYNRLAIYKRGLFL